MITEASTEKKFLSKTSVLYPGNVGRPEIETYKKKIDSDWRVISGSYLERTFKTKDFNDSLVLTNKIGILAQEHNYQPEITLSGKSVKVTLYPKIMGTLSAKDFSMASLIDLIYF